MSDATYDRRVKSQTDDSRVTAEIVWQIHIGIPECFPAAMQDPEDRNDDWSQIFNISSQFDKFPPFLYINPLLLYRVTLTESDSWALTDPLRQSGEQ